MKKIVAAAAELTELHRRRITECAAEYGYTAEFYESNAQAIPHAADAEILYGMGAELYRACKGAKWFCSVSAGVDQYLQDDVQREDLILTNSSGAYGLTIAEHTVMVTLEVLRRRKDYDSILARREWKRDLPISSIYGSRVTVAGTGNIGTEIARRFRAFLPERLIGVNRSGRRSAEELFDEIVTQEELDRILPETDILILALPGTGETQHFLSRERIARLPETACVVNVGRGSAVDQKALLCALNERRLRGAALDVFEVEPLPKEDPAWDCPYLIVTPHSSGNMSLSHTIDMNVEQFCRDLVHYCKGEPLEHLVNTKKGY